MNFIDKKERNIILTISLISTSETQRTVDLNKLENIIILAKRYSNISEELLTNFTNTSNMIELKFLNLYRERDINQKKCDEKKIDNILNELNILIPDIQNMVLDILNCNPIRNSAEFIFYLHVLLNKAGVVYVSTFSTNRATKDLFKNVSRDKYNQNIEILKTILNNEN